VHYVIGSYFIYKLIFIILVTIHIIIALYFIDTTE
jgi:hypothetical protein